MVPLLLQSQIKEADVWTCPLCMLMLVRATQHQTGVTTLACKENDHSFRCFTSKRFRSSVETTSAQHFAEEINKVQSQDEVSFLPENVHVWYIGSRFEMGTAALRPLSAPHWRQNNLKHGKQNDI